ncbi:MAG: oxidoreductase [Gemmatimonadales bacterium]|nr:oxidoreductase [Gemmatimonadales bacterium]
MRRTSLALFTLLMATACGPIADHATETEWTPTLTLTLQESGTDALLQAISFGDGGVIWASGHQATWVRSVDRGETWTAGTVEGAEGLQFRDVHAFGGFGAYLMSSGNGDLSRIYRTDDRGQSWTLQYTAYDRAAFIDCMDFWSEDRGLVYGDAVDGVPFILSTEDGGATWGRVPAERLPVALQGEGGFAASGTCLVTGDDGRAWIATGNGERARVLSTMDYGVTWTATDVPVPGGTSAGLTTVQMNRESRGIAMGGIIGQDSVRTDNMVTTLDGGATWQLAAAPSIDGPVYGVALVDFGPESHILAVGPRGLSWSTDFAETWVTVDTLSYWAVAHTGAEDGWAVGPGGRIAHLAIGGRASEVPSGS